MPSQALDARGVVELEGVILSAPGLRGTVSVERARPGGSLRGSGRAREALDDALEQLEMQTDRTIVVEDPRESAGRSAATRGGRRETAPVLSLAVPGPTEGREQVVLAVDEHGIASWRFGTAEEARGVRAARNTRRYEIPRVVARPEGEAATRGLIPGLTKVIRVISFPIAKAVGQAARFAAREWDVQRHPPRLRSYGPKGTLADLDDKGLGRLSKGRALLFVHGTFSTTEGAFGRLPATTFAELNRRYAKRVFAYDHPTIADDPFENARRFFSLIGDRRLDLDIVCHSRGGLVARSIAERPGDLADLSPGVSVRSIVLVGVPSNGTILAKAKYWNELLDRMTTLINLVPGPGIPDILETVLAVVRSIAVETAENLEGLDAMAPGGDFLKRLNTGPANPKARYRAIVSDFEPRSPGIKAWLNDVVRDRIFDGKPNDMMVSIESMTAANGSGRFPVTDIRAFKAAEGIEHAAYFPEGATSKALLRWLRT
ncbi:MAG TPA: alpha/beta fold hydrolase [Candidatus Limnocylindrales bacterium]